MPPETRCADCDSVVVLSIPEAGNGRCRHCHGKGTVHEFHTTFTGHREKCPYCKGTGQCQTCGGKGRVRAIASPEARPAAKPPVAQQTVTLDSVEREWYHLCNSAEFMATEVVADYLRRLTEAGHAEAVVVGLTDFSDGSCPSCDASGQFKVHFLGELRHPECSARWYVSPLRYTGFQLAAVLHSGVRAGGAMKEEYDRKGQSGGWLGAILGFYFAAVFRALIAVGLVPLQILIYLLSRAGSKSRKEETPGTYQEGREGSQTPELSRGGLRKAVSITGGILALFVVIEMAAGGQDFGRALAAVFLSPMAPSSDLGGVLRGLTFIGTAIWAAIDSSRVLKTGWGGKVLIFLAFLFLWIVSFPLYLARHFQCAASATNASSATTQG